MSGKFKWPNCLVYLTEMRVHSETNPPLKPNMRNPDNPELSREMVENLLQGMNIMNPYLIPSAFKTWTFQLFDILDTKELIDEKNSVYFIFLDNLFSQFLHGKIGSLFVRPIFSNLMYTNIYLANLWEKYILIESNRKIT